MRVSMIMRMYMCEIQLEYSALAFARRAQNGSCSADAIKCTNLLLEANTKTNSDSRLPAPATLTSHKRKLPSDALEEDDSESSDDDVSESSSSDDDDDEDGDREEMRSIGSLFLASEFNAATGNDAGGNETDDEDFDWDDVFAMD